MLVKVSLAAYTLALLNAYAEGVSYYMTVNYIGPSSTNPHAHLTSVPGSSPPIGSSVLLNSLSWSEFTPTAGAQQSGVPVPVKPTIGNLQVVRDADINSVDLFGASFTGQQMNVTVYEFAGSGITPPLAIVQYALGHASIQSASFAGNGSSTLQETLSIAPTTVQLSVTTQQKDGQAGTTGSFSWNITENPSSS